MEGLLYARCPSSELTCRRRRLATGRDRHINRVVLVSMVKQWYEKPRILQKGWSPRLLMQPRWSGVWSPPKNYPNKKRRNEGEKEEREEGKRTGREDSEEHIAHIYLRWVRSNIMLMTVKSQEMWTGWNTGAHSGHQSTSLQGQKLSGANIERTGGEQGLGCGLQWDCPALPHMAAGAKATYLTLPHASPFFHTMRTRLEPTLWVRRVNGANNHEALKLVSCT